MQHIKQHIIFKGFAILLVLLVFMPSTLKLTHALSHSHHKHEVCLGEKQAHLHTLDVDCEFHKFQLNSAFSLPENTYTFLERRNNHHVINSQYYFISDFQQLHFSLRGPPFTS